MYHLYKKTKNKKTLCWMQYKVYWHILKKKSTKKIAWGDFKIIQQSACII